MSTDIDVIKQVLFAQLRGPEQSKLCILRTDASWYLPSQTQYLS